MPKEEWAKNPVHKIMGDLWTFGEGEINTVLDVACGLSLKSKFLGAKHIVGVDIYEPYLRAIEHSGSYSVVKYDVRKLSDIFLSNSFDLVMAMDIIEHLDKSEGEDLICQCKKIAKKAVIIETPNGFIPQNLDILGFNANELQTHKCGWTKKELEGYGFQCVVRPYTMANIKRHTHIDVDINVEVIDAIFIKGNQ